MAGFDILMACSAVCILIVVQFILMLKIGKINAEVRELKQRIKGQYK